MEVSHPYEHVCPSVGWPVFHNFLNGQEVSLHAPIGALVLIQTNLYISGRITGATVGI